MGTGLFLLRYVMLAVILLGCAAPPPAVRPPASSQAAMRPRPSSPPSPPGPSSAPETAGPSAEEYQPVVIAIMPFTNISGQKELDWLCTGIAESISSKLGSLPYFSLVERIKLAEAMKEIELGQTGVISEDTAARTGQMAGAEELVIGSFQVVGQTIRINARFLKVAKATAHTAAEATGKMGEIFELQDQIVASFLANMGLPLNDQEKSLLAAKPTNSPEAFQLYSRAMDTYTPEGRAQSDEQRVALLDQSTQIDPNFAPAFISLGDIYFLMMRDYDRAAIYYNRAVILRPHVVAPRVRLVQIYQNQGNTSAAQLQQRQIVDIRRSPALQQTTPEKRRFLEERRRIASIKFQEEQWKTREMQTQRSVQEQQKAQELQKQRAIHEQQKVQELQKQRGLQEQQKARALPDRQKSPELYKPQPVQNKQKVQELHKPGPPPRQQQVQQPQKRPPAPQKKPAPVTNEKKKTY
jgi:TolB-like protein